MNIVHVPFGYFPDAVGGTEVYVAELARALKLRGVDSVVAAPSSTGMSSRYDHDGVSVHRFRLDTSEDVGELYGEGDAAAAHVIGSILDEVDADVLHLHAFTRAASLRAAREARRRGMAVVFTYHTPTASCVRGTLLHDGREPCDGALFGQRCAACLLQSRGAPRVVREVLSRTPTAISTAVSAIGATSSWATALRARELTEARHQALRHLLHEADAIVAVCEWVRALLIRAGAPPSRVTMSRQGTPAGVRRAPDARVATDMTRLAYVGRLHPTKGAHVVLRALRDAPDLPVTLDVFGIVQEADGARYHDELRALTRDDPRIRFHAAVAADQVVETLARYDATIVPSQWLETGPLTVLESFAAGVPVIGSNLGGIAELVMHDHDGWLVPYGDARAWTAALRRFATDRQLIERLRAGVRPPRSTDDVARDMTAVYEAIVQRRSPVTVEVA